MQHFDLNFIFLIISQTAVIFDDIYHLEQDSLTRYLLSGLASLE